MASWNQGRHPRDSQVSSCTAFQVVRPRVLWRAYKTGRCEKKQDETDINLQGNVTTSVIRQFCDLMSLEVTEAKEVDQEDEEKDEGEVEHW